MYRMNIDETEGNSKAVFSGLFALLKRYDVTSPGSPVLDYSCAELESIQEHLDYAIELLLQGIQDMGCLMHQAGYNEAAIHRMNYIGFFITTVTNLIEELHALRGDVSHSLAIMTFESVRRLSSSPE